MSRHFVAASSQSLSKASAIITAAPLTIAAWVLPTTHTAVNDVVGIDNGATATDGFLLRQWSDGTIRAQTGPGFQSSTTVGTVTNGVWAHVGAVFGSITSRIAYLNGVGATAETTSNTPGALTTTHVGAIFAPQNFYNGDIAWVTFWNVGLSAAEMALLATGILPGLVRPTNIIANYELVGTASPETDSVSALNLTVNGGATQGPSTPPMKSALMLAVF